MLGYLRQVIRSQRYCTCVLIVCLYMHAQLKLPLMVVGIEVCEDKEQLVGLFCTCTSFLTHTGIEESQ